MKCPNCYTELPDTAKMCYKCKKQIIPDRSEEDTSKICPNCGMALPLTATMCYCCKYVFNSTGTLGQNNQFQNNTGTLTSNYQSRFTTVDRNNGYNGQRNYQSGGNGNSPESLRKNAMMICLIGSILCGIAVFMPYMGINIFGVTVSISIIDNAGYGIETLFWAVASIIFCVPNRQKTGAGHIILGVISIINCIFNAIRIPSSYKNTNLIQREVGVYVLLIGSIMVLASGIMMKVASKRE